MKNLEIILSLCGTIIGLLITVFTFLLKTVSSVRAKRVAEQAISIGNAVLPYIREAEKFTGLSGAEKKAYVMTKVSQFAMDNCIPFDSIQVSAKIEELVELTKQVNFKKVMEPTSNTVDEVAKPDLENPPSPESQN